MMKKSLQNLLVKGKNAFLSLNHASSREFVLSFLLLLFLPTQLGKHFWPQYALVSGFRVDYLSPTLYGTDILIILLFLHICIYRTLPFSRNGLIRLGLLLIFLLICVSQAVEPLASLYTIGKVFEIGFLISFLSFRLRLRSHLNMSMVALSLGIIGESILAVSQFWERGYLGGWLYYVGERAISNFSPGAATVTLQGEVFLRSYGTFSHPNVLAGFLVICMTFILLNLQGVSRGTSKFFFTATLVIGTAGLLPTLSRVPVILWIVILLGYGSRFLRREYKTLPRLKTFDRGGVLLLCVLTLLLLTPFFFPLIARFQASRLTEESFVVRYDLTHNALLSIASHPLLGVGPGNFIYESLLFKNPEDPLYFAVQPVHNIFLLVTSEIGLLGLFLFVWLLLLAIAAGNTKSHYLLYVVIVLGMVDHYLLTLQQGQLLFAFVLGYMFSTYAGNYPTPQITREIIAIKKRSRLSNGDTRKKPKKSVIIRNR